MTDGRDAIELAKRAFELADAGRLDEATALYLEAVAGLDPTHYWSPQVHGQFASVLTQLGRIEEAGEQYARALQLERDQALGQETPAVAVARYFLAEHYLTREDPNRALATIQPALHHPSRLDALIRTVEAEALSKLGRTEDARAAAVAALRASGSDEQSRKVRDRLAALLNVDEAS
jgi:tetratricopeptide (TPR) repeat protein